MVASLNIDGVAFGQTEEGARKILILTPEKSISVEGLRRFEIAAGNSEAPVAAALEADAVFAYQVRSGDTLEKILREQWGLAPAKDYVTEEQAKRILELKQNEAIAARPAKLAAIKPGDTLYIPSTIAGMRKTGSFAVAAPADVDPQKLVKDSFGDTPAPHVQEADGVKIASLSNVGVCSDAQGIPPYDAAGVLSRVKVADRRPPQGRGDPADRIIAVIDAGLRGKLDPLKPFIPKPVIQPDRYASEGGAFVPLRSGILTDLISKTVPKSQHGTHIMTLALGGEARLGQAGGATWSRAPWGLVPIVVEAGKQLDNGTIAPEIQPAWIGFALSYAKERKAKIVNLSLEAQQGDFIATNMRGRYDTLFVVAAGNGRLFVERPPDEPVKTIDFEFVGSQDRQFHVMPAMLGGPARGHVISVAAHADDLELTKFSGRHDQYVDIAAPGVCIRSYSSLGDDFAGSAVHGVTGTSQAAAIVSFAASLVADAMGLPAFTPGDVKARLLATSIYDAGKYGGLLSSRGRLSVERAVAVRFDIVRYRDNDQIVEEIGDFDNVQGNTLPINQLQICATPPSGAPSVTIRDVWKAIPSGSGPKAQFEFVRRKKMPFVVAENLDDPFDWTWKTCVANWGNVNRIGFKRHSDGKLLTIRFEDLIELIPRHSER
jgi:hypothetical protein